MNTEKASTSTCALSLLKAATCAAISKYSVLGWDLAIACFQPSIVYSLTAVSIEDWITFGGSRPQTSLNGEWTSSVASSFQFSPHKDNSITVRPGSGETYLE